MRIETEEYLDFADVLLKPKRSILSSRNQVSLTREFRFKHSPRQLVSIPIIAANMDTVGTIEAGVALSKNRIHTALHKYYTNEELSEVWSEHIYHFSNFFLTVGSNPIDVERMHDLFRDVLKTTSPNICIDVANGYSQKFVDFCKTTRNYFPDSVIMAGNVATPEIVEELILNGAVDIVKIGIGSGAHCTTRIVAGVGVPQFSAVVECADAAHGVGGHICSDGGITHPSDVLKALGAGADFVMIGSAFAGHDESGGEEVYDDGVLIGKETYGMSSSTAMQKYDQIKSYRSSEGRTSIVPYRGPIQDTVDYFLGGLRSGMTYIGAENIKEIPKRATFIKVNRQLNETYKDSTLKIR